MKDVLNITTGREDVSKVILLYTSFIRISNSIALSIISVHNPNAVFQ